MIDKEEIKMLSDMQNQLGRIEATTSELKDDIKELKEKDAAQSHDLETAYAKAKARQDSIKDGLQKQIDNTQKLIETVNNNFNKSLESISCDFNNTVKAFSDNTTEIIKMFNENITKMISAQNKVIVEQNDRIDDIVNNKGKKLTYWWDKIIDKVIWFFLLGALGAFFQWIGLPQHIIQGVTK
jgi:hypothetical protein